MNKKLRLQLVIEMFGNKDLLKAVSMFLLIRKRLGGNTIRRYSINKIVTLLGAHARTVEKRMRVLFRYGLVSMSGESLVLRSVVSKHTNRNVKLGDRKVSYENLKSVERSLQAILVVFIQNRKDFAKRTIRNAHGGSHDYKVVKAARDMSRKFGYGLEYVEKGLSYKTIAKKLGVSIKTAVEVIKFAVNRAFLKKEKHFFSEFMPFVNGREVYPYTFATRNYVYKIFPNTYSVSPALV